MAKCVTDLNGIIGSSWAMVFASAGYRVSLFDVDKERIQASLADITDKLNYLEGKGTLRGNLTANAQQTLITGSSSLEECVKDAFFIQESVPEVLDVKRQLYTQLDMLMTNKTILSSSSSALMPSKLSDGLRHKSRFIVSHPANPPYFVPVVELVPAPWTDPEVVSQTRRLMSEIGQCPIVCKKEQLGFALCRMQYAIINECWRLVKDGYLNVEDVDKVLSDGLGRRYAFLGPFETAHLNAEGMESYLQKYREMIWHTSQTLGPVPRLEGTSAKDIADQLCNMVPLHKLEARKKWRDDCLAALNKLRNELETI